MSEPPLRLPDGPETVHQETHEVSPGYWATLVELVGGRRVRVMQADDPGRRWARGSGLPRWRQLTVVGRRFDWREVDGECVVFERQGDVLVWVHGAGMSVDELLPVALAVTPSR